MNLLLVLLCVLIPWRPQIRGYVWSDGYPQRDNPWWPSNGAMVWAATSRMVSRDEWVEVGLWEVR